MAKQVTPEQYAAGVDRGIQKLRDQIQELSKGVRGARTLRSGLRSGTAAGRELMVDDAQQVRKLKEDLKNALETAGKAKEGYQIRYSQDPYQNLSAKPDEVTYSYPYSDYFLKAHRGRKASSSSEKD